MTLTDAQKATLKTHILANQDTATLYADGNLDGLAQLLNADATPSFFVWKIAVVVDDIMGNGFDWTRVDNLTVGKARIWEWMTRLGVINMAKTNIRAGIEACFTADVADRPNRTAVYQHGQRRASRIERLFATGTGTTTDDRGVGPGLLGYEGPINYTELIGL